MVSIHDELEEGKRNHRAQRIIRINKRIYSGRVDLTSILPFYVKETAKDGETNDSNRVL